MYGKSVLHHRQYCIPITGPSVCGDNGDHSVARGAPASATARREVILRSPKGCPNSSRIETRLGLIGMGGADPCGHRTATDCLYDQLTYKLALQ